MSSGSPEDGFGGIISKNNLDEESTTRVIDIGEKLTLRFEVYENSGASRIEHVSLYLNGKGHYNLLEGDTYIRYHQFKDLEIKDQYGLFSKVDFKINEIDSGNAVLIFEIVFDKPMDTSDLLLRMWDNIKNQQDLDFVDAIQVIQSKSITQTTPSSDDGSWSKSFESSLTKSITVASPDFKSTEAPLDESPQQTVTKIQKIPLWIKNNAKWWSHNEIDNDDFVAGIQYLIEKNIIQGPDRHIGTILETHPSTEIPVWVKTSAGWWADDLISDEEFMLSIEWLINEEIIVV